ncbi:MAG: BamA/TamA family outer membrane protein [Candidatus Delongbacteria bacterium]|nr:BamA/TamA family outer membrane protein [Candidatus Delongbacteria bacterium]
MNIDIKHTGKYFNTLVVLFVVVLIVSCRSTKLVPEDEYLLNKLEIKCDNPNFNEGDLMPSIKQRPNRKTLGLFRFHLGVYNLTHSKDSTKADSTWIRRMGKIVGEPPEIYHPSLRYKSKKNIVNFLEHRGYYNASVEDTLIPDEKNPQKAKLVFNVNTGKPYYIRNFTYSITDPFIKDVVLEDTSKSRVKEGMIFDSENLMKEMERITGLMKNHGYYYFSEDNIHYYADTTETPYKVDLTITIKKSFEAERYFLDEIFTPQKIKKVYFYINFDRGAYAVNKEQYIEQLDTVKVDEFYFLIDGEMKLKPEVILNENYINPGELYQRENVTLTQKNLAALKQFKLINIIFKENKEKEKSVWNAENPWLDAHIYLSPSLRQSYSVEAEGTNSSGNYGLAGVLTYNNRNLLHGAEIFSTKLTGSLQSMISSEQEERFLNTFEYGAQFTLDVPKFMIPWQTERFVKQYNPTTNFSLSFNHQNRPDYTRSLGNTSFGYSWHSKNDYYTHSLNPIEYYTVKIFDFDQVFMQQIDSLYIKYSFQDQLITASSYNMSFNNQNIKKSRNHWLIWTNLETSGNLFRAFAPTLNLPINEENAYSIFDLQFAQYIKGDIDARFYQEINRSNNLVYRVSMGAGIPYGNSTQGLPFVKKYYIGGANDIRAWQVRTLGPGSYNGGALYNQIADMKLLLNFEYRFDLIAFIEGALFLDAGNIWALDPSDNREGAMFHPATFYKEIALGTGLGLRFDFSFFILRFDFGVPLYDPAFPLNERWLGTFREFQINDFTLNFGIGYPF